MRTTKEHSKQKSQQAIDSHPEMDEGTNVNPTCLKNDLKTIFERERIAGKSRFQELQKEESFFNIAADA